MTKNSQKVLNEALELPPIERAEIIERLLTSFEFPSRTAIDEMWAIEIEDRLSAFERGEIRSISAKEVFDNIGRK